MVSLYFPYFFSFFFFLIRSAGVAGSGAASSAMGNRVSSAATSCVRGRVTGTGLRRPGTTTRKVRTTENNKNVFILLLTANPLSTLHDRSERPWGCRSYTPTPRRCQREARTKYETASVENTRLKPACKFCSARSLLPLGQVVVAQAAVERGGGDAEYLGGLAAVPAGLFECGENLLSLD